MSFLLPSNETLVSNVDNLHYSGEKDTIFILHVFTYIELYAYFYIFIMIVLIVFEAAIVKLIKVYNLVFFSNINFIFINTILWYNMR